MRTDSTIPNNDEDSKEKIILQAALKAFAIYGIGAATTRQIAEIAGIGKSTIYEYFKNKEELLKASFHYLMSNMNESHREIHEIALKDPVLALNCYLDSAIQISINEPSTLLLITQYTLSNLMKTNEFETTKSEYQKQMYPVMEDLIDEFRYIISNGIEKKVFHPTAGLTTEGLVYTVCALIREIQAQAFLQNREDLLKTTSIIKETVLKLLGVVCSSK